MSSIKNDLEYHPPIPRSEWRGYGNMVSGANGIDELEWVALGNCEECTGKGRVWVRRRRTQRLTTCPVCNGTGFKEDLP